MMSQPDNFANSNNDQRSQQASSFYGGVICDSVSSIVNNKKQIFEIIDSIISLESCLHYQFIPLALQNQVLTLGMINPEDRNGYNFIYPIVASLNYTLEISEIDSSTHQLILAAYLKRDLTEAQNSDSEPFQNNPQSNSLQNTPQQSADSELNSSLTLVDVPNQPHDDSPIPAQLADSELNSSLTLIDISTPQEQDNSSIPSLHERATLIVNPNEQSTSDSNSTPDNIALSPPEIFSSEPQITGSNSLEFNPHNLHQSESNPNLLQVEAHYLNESVEVLASLSPQQLWQELLARILDGGIGRLYLERHPYHGRIIWSRDGVVQSSLEKVEIAIFNHIIQEIKVLGKQPLTPIEKNKKVAVEKFYNQERILVRIEFLLNQYGEEITVQILRNKALKFYEQRQIKKMMDHALSLSKKLEKTLKKMIFCRSSGELENINSLKSVVAQIEKQIMLLEKKSKNPQD